MECYGLNVRKMSQKLRAYTYGLHSISGYSKTLEDHRALVKKLGSIGKMRRGHVAVLALSSLGGEKVGEAQIEEFTTVSSTPTSTQGTCLPENQMTFASEFKYSDIAE